MWPSTRRLAAVLAVAALALAVPTAAQAVDVISLGGDVEVRMNAGDIEVLENGLVVDSRPCCDDYAIHGAATLTITNPTGSIVPVHVTFDGNALSIAGGAADSGSAGPDSVVYRQGTGVQTVDHTGTTSVTDTVATPSLALTATPGADTVTIGDSPIAGGLTIASPTFPSYALTNKTSVSLDTLGGDDTVAMANTSPPAGLTGAFTVATGGAITVGDADYTGADLVLRTAGAIADSNGPGAVNVTADRLDVRSASVDLDTAVTGVAGDVSGGAAFRNLGDLTVEGLTAPGGGELRAEKMLLAGRVDAGGASLALFATEFSGAGTLRAGKLALTDASQEGRAWQIGPGTVGPIAYEGVSDLSLTGGSGPDSFAAKASPTTTYAISGGGSLKDTLLYDREGRAVGGDTVPPDGVITSPGVQNVLFSQIERVRIPCAAACDTPPPARGACANPLAGTDGPDAFGGTASGDAITGGEGDDVINALAGQDCVSGDAGDDTLFGDVGEDGLRGADGDDRLFGGRGADPALRGGVGDDRLSGGDGDDHLYGDAGADRLTGGSGDDQLSGGSGNDLLVGSGGRNRLFGGPGADQLRAGNGVREHVDCGLGDDRANVDPTDVVRGCERVHVVSLDPLAHR